MDIISNTTNLFPSLRAHSKKLTALHAMFLALTCYQPDFRKTSAQEFYQFLDFL